MTPAEHRAEADRLVRLCYTAEPISDEVLPDITISGGERHANMLAAAQVHATLALAPQQPAQPPQQRIDTSKPVHVYDIGGAYFEVTAASSGGVVIAHDDSGFGTIIEDPAKIRLFAAALTAHADRMEPKP